MWDTSHKTVLCLFIMKAIFFRITSDIVVFFLSPAGRSLLSVMVGEFHSSAYGLLDDWLWVEGRRTELVFYHVPLFSLWKN